MRAKKHRQRSWPCERMPTADNVLREDLVKPKPRECPRKKSKDAAAPKMATIAAPTAAEDKGSTEWRQCPECKFIREVKVKR